MLPIGDVLFLYISFAYARSLFPFIFLWVYSHTSHRRRFLPYPYFLKRCVPMRRLSAESRCGLSSLCILSSTIFFRPAPVNAIFSIFLFSLPPGAFYLTLPVVIHPFAFDRILFLEDLLAHLFQRRCITAHTAAGICKTRGLTSNWGQSSFDALFKPLKELIS